MARPVKIGLDVVAGDNDWVNDKLFIYDEDCTTKLVVEKQGGARDGDAHWLPEETTT